MTAHRSKGLEFERVYIINAADKVWGNRRMFSSFELPEAVYRMGKEPLTAPDDGDERVDAVVVVQEDRPHVQGLFEVAVALFERLDPEFPPPDPKLRGLRVE